MRSAYLLLLSNGAHAFVVPMSEGGKLMRTTPRSSSAPVMQFDKLIPNPFGGGDEPEPPPPQKSSVAPSKSSTKMALERWPTEKIFDDSLPDPLFDRDSGYKGRVPYGFSNTAENINGRVAMMGFVVAFLQVSGEK